MIIHIASLDSVPDILRESVLRWWERAGGQDAWCVAYAALPETLRDELPRVVAGSEFAAAALSRDPEALAWLSRNTAPADVQQANSEYERRASGATSGAEAQRLLREWRRREMLRIAWCEIGRASCRERV